MAAKLIHLEKTTRRKSFTGTHTAICGRRVSVLALTSRPETATCPQCQQLGAIPATSSEALEARLRDLYCRVIPATDDPETRWHLHREVDAISGERNARRRALEAAGIEA